MARPFKTEANFMDHVSPEPNSGCWLWTGETDRRGYGRFWYSYNREMAHRFSYRTYVADIPKGKLVLHSCDTPCCVNPNHLRIGTHLDNQADAIAKGRHTHGTKHGAAKLTERDVLAIRASPDYQYVIGKRYGVSQSVVCAIKSRRIWKHIP